MYPAGRCSRRGVLRNQRVVLCSQRIVLRSQGVAQRSRQRNVLCNILLFSHGNLCSILLFTRSVRCNGSLTRWSPVLTGVRSSPGRIL